MTAVLDQMEQLQKLDRDLRDASRLLGRKEARYLTDLYYQIQDFRTSAASQARAGEGEPNRVLTWCHDSMRRLEENIKRSLGEFSGSYCVGAWLQSITGIGPVISAGLLSHLDIRKAKTAGHFWRFAGLDSEDEWLGSEKSKAIVADIVGTSKVIADAHIDAAAARIRRRREYILNTAMFLKKTDAPPKITRELLTKVLSVRPWNAKLKCLAYKMCDCFVKFQNHKNDHYGKLYAKRKEYEQARNDRGELAGQAAAALSEKNYGKETEARKWYEDGKLPPAHIHARAMRWTEKIAFSHLHTVMYKDYYGEDPPVPYVFAKCPGDHRHFIAIPNYPHEFEGKGLVEMVE
jgi:hypothetical protein